MKKEIIKILKVNETELGGGEYSDIGVSKYRYDYVAEQIEQLILNGVGSTFTEKEKETLILLLHSEIQNTNEICFNNLDTQEYINHHSKLIEKIEKQP